MSSSIAPICWPAEALWEAVAPLLSGFTVEVLPSVDSTNSELMRRARAGLCEPTLLVAEAQTAGRGRMGRAWQSGADTALATDTPQAAPAEAVSTPPLPSLMMSLGLPLAPRDWSGLSLAVGVSVAESLQPQAATEPAHASSRIGLKWPNDLWLGGDRKLGGILVETASLVGPAAPACAPGTRYVVVGIGLNVLPRQAQGLSTPPGCLQDVDPRWDAPAALACIVPPLVQTLLQFEAQGFAPFRTRFGLRDVLQGRPVTLSDGQTGTAHGVADDGALLVHTAAGMQSVTSAEISVRPSPLPPV